MALAPSGPILFPPRLIFVTDVFTCIGRYQKSEMSGLEGGYRGAKWRKQDEVDVKNSEESGKSRPQARSACLERLGDGGRALNADRIISEFEVL